MINKLLTGALAVVFVMLAGAATAGVAHVTDVDGVVTFNILSISWDNDFCELTLTSDDPLACGSGTCELLPDSCTSLLKLDGQFYPLEGIMNRNMGGVWFTDADASVANCRRADGGPLPGLQAPAIVVNGFSINLDAQVDVVIEPTDYGARVAMTSSPGDVICDGAISEPQSLLFKDGFE